MIHQIIFTQNELVEMLQGKKVGMASKNGESTLFSMENHESVHENPVPPLTWNHNKTEEPLISQLTKKETDDLLNGKKTINQIREEHDFPPISDISSYLTPNYDHKQMRWTYVYLAADGLPEDIRRFILQYVSSTGLKFDFFRQYDSAYEDFVVYCDTDEQMKQLNDHWKEIQKEYYDECNR